MATPSQITKIHVMVKKLQIADDDYRAMLSAYGVESSLDNKFSFEMAGNFIKKLVSLAAERKIPVDSARADRRGYATKAQKAMLWKMWLQVTVMKEKNEQETAFRKFIKNRWRIDSPEWLPQSAVPKIKRALEGMGATYDQ